MVIDLIMIMPSLAETPCKLDPLRQRLKTSNNIKLYKHPQLVHTFAESPWNTFNQPLVQDKPCSYFLSLSSLLTPNEIPDPKEATKYMSRKPNERKTSSIHSPQPDLLGYPLRPDIASLRCDERMPLCEEDNRCSTSVSTTRMQFWDC